MCYSLGIATVTASPVPALQQAQRISAAVACAKCPRTYRHLETVACIMKRSPPTVRTSCHLSLDAQLACLALHHPQPTEYSIEPEFHPVTLIMLTMCL